MRRLLSGAGVGIVEDWIIEGVFDICVGNVLQGPRMSHRKSRFDVNLALNIISQRGGAHRAGFVRILHLCPINRKPSSEMLIDKVNITIESGRYTIYVDFYLFPLFDNCTALCKIAVLKRYD